MAEGSSTEGGGDLLTGLGNIFTTAFGSGPTKQFQRGSGTEKGTVTRQLEIEEEGVQKILQDILGSEQGLASIFSEESVAGLFDTTVSKQAAGDLLANLAGEIAKLQAKEVETRDIKTTQEATSKSKSKGVFSNIFG